MRELSSVEVELVSGGVPTDLELATAVPTDLELARAVPTDLEL